MTTDSNTNSSSTSFEDEPLLSLLTKDVNTMTEEERRQFVIHLQTLRKSAQTFRARLESEGKASKGKAAKVEKKIELDDYLDLV